MSVYNLDFLFKPKRIAIFDVKPEESSLGSQIFKNLILQGFKGGVYPISEQEESIFGIEPYPDLASLPRPVDLAILAGEPENWWSQLKACAANNVKAVVILGLDFSARTENPSAFMKKIAQFAHERKIRVLGPNTLGFICPRLRLNASLFPGSLTPGNLAFLSDSATLAYAILDWAEEKKVGFSLFVSLGEKADVDLSDLIDYLTLDPYTKAIVAYIKNLKSGRKFMRAARAFARNKPIVVVKGKKLGSSQNAEETLSLLAQENLVYDAAFKRAGVVQVEEILELFYLAESLAKQPRPKGPRLVIISNAGGPAMIAAEYLQRLGGTLARLSPKTTKTLHELLGREIQNPIDLLSSAPPHLFRETLKACLKDSEVDGALAIFTPSLEAPVEDFAWSIVRAHKEIRWKPVLASLMGENRVLEGRRILAKEGIPNFVSPTEAVKSFVYMYRYDHNLRLITETPGTILEDFSPDKTLVNSIIEKATKENRLILTSEEAASILQAYGIIGRYNNLSDIPVSFFLGTTRDPSFGATILFGLGGFLLEPERDYAIGLPPLNQTLARRLLEETKIYWHLKKNLKVPLSFLEELLVRFSHLIVDFPEIKEVFIPALEISRDEIKAPKAEILLDEIAFKRTDLKKGYFCPAHLAICPYPSHFIFEASLKDGTKIFIRPIKPEDEPLMAELFYTLSEETIRFRFHQIKKSISHEELVRYCQIDYDREMALVAVQKENGREKIIGVVRLNKYPDEETAEMAVVVGDPWQGKGLGKILSEKMLSVAGDMYLKRIRMHILKENEKMLTLAQKLGFKPVDLEEDIVRVEKILN